MKLRMLVCVGVVASLLAGTGLTAASAGDKSDQPAKSEVRISKSEAKRTALTKVPNGKLKQTELERENGRAVWSFDIATPGTKEITEVLIDATTGEVVAVEKETPPDQAKEQRAEKAGRAKSGKPSGTAAK